MPRRGEGRGVGREGRYSKQRKETPPNDVCVQGFWISHPANNHATLCVCVLCAPSSVCVSGVARGEWGCLIMNALIWYSREGKDKPLY